MSQRSLCTALIAFAVVFAAGAPTAFADDATVPCVVGLPLDQAQLMLEQAGFTTSVERVQGRPIGIVVSQEPGGLAKRAKGTPIRLVVGGAPPKFRPPKDVPSERPPAGVPPVGPDIGSPPTGVPPTGPLPDDPAPSRPSRPLEPADPGVPPTSALLAVDGRPIPPEAAPNANGPPLPAVIGQPAAQARGALRRWRVSVEYTLAVPELVGKVVNQWPHGGRTLAPGEGVIVVVAVAQPPSPTYSGVPQVERSEWRAAMRMLSAAGFRPDPTSVPSTDAQRGTVLSQQPLPGSLAPRGGAVRIRVGRGSDTTKPPVLPRAEPPAQPPAELPRVPDTGPPAGVPPVAPPLEPPPAAPPTEQPPVAPPAQPPVAPEPPTGPQPRSLAAPTLTKPDEGDAYPFRYGANFAWTEVRGASAYEWELEEELPSGAWQKVDSRMVPDTKFRPEKLRQGRYRWRVRAVHAATKGAWSDFRRLYMY